MQSEEIPVLNQQLVNSAGINRMLGSGRCSKQARQEGWRIVDTGPYLRIYENPQAFPIAYLSRRWQTVDEPATKTIGRTAREPRNTTFRSHTDYVEGTGPERQDGGIPVKASVIRESPEQVKVSIPSKASKGGLLVLLDSFHKDWKAESDGKNLEVVRVNGMFRGVRLSPGERSVVFSYSPPWRTPLTILALISGLIVGGLAIYGVWDVRRGTVVRAERRPNRG